MPYEIPNSDHYHPESRSDQEKWFRGIYDLHWKKLYSYCYYHIQDATVAEEMLQDIFYSIWERRQTLDIQVPVEHYLVRAAKYKVIDYLRAQSLHGKHLGHALQDQPRWDNATDDTIHFQELSESISELIDTLPAQRQQVFRLSRQEGLNNREIAASMMISEKTVEFHLTKALAFLRKRLSAYGF